MDKKQQIVRRITDGDEEFIVVKPDFIENLEAELEKVKRERDAAVEKYKRMKEDALILSEAVAAYDRQNHKKYNSSGVQENGGAEDA